MHITDDVSGLSFLNLYFGSPTGRNWAIGGVPGELLSEAGCGKGVANTPRRRAFGANATSASRVRIGSSVGTEARGWRRWR